jgi:hypothetical protein
LITSGEKNQGGKKERKSEKSVEIETNKQASFYAKEKEINMPLKSSFRTFYSNVSACQKEISKKTLRSKLFYLLLRVTK